MSDPAPPPAPAPTDGDTLQRTFLLGSVAGVSMLFLWMVQGFLMALLLGAIAAGLASPVHRRVLAWCGDRRALAAGLVVLGLVLLVIGPLLTFFGIVVSEAVQITQAVGPWIEERMNDPAALSGFWQKIPFVDRLPLETLLPEREQILEVVGNGVRGAGSILIDGLAAAGRGTAKFFLELFIFLYAVFYFLLSGRETLERILYLSPLESRDEARIIERFLSVTRATLRGSLLIGGLQGLLAGLGFAAAGVPGAAFWGTIVVVLSVIPGIGAPLVWVPAVLWLLAVGETLPALLLAAWCAALVGTVDNLLRPRLVGSDAKMSDLLILVSTLGGISLFGPVGFVVGPIVAAVFVTLWDVFGRAFADSLPPIAPHREEHVLLGDGEDVALPPDPVDPSRG